MPLALGLAFALGCVDPEPSEPGAAVEAPASPAIRGPLPSEQVKDSPFHGPNAPAGRWGPFLTHRYYAEVTTEQREMLEQLEAIGYLSGVRESPAMAGVTVHEADDAYPGLNFYVSGHAPEAVLMDMDGNELHRWHMDFWKVWPDYPAPRHHLGAQFWRRAYLYPNGDVLAIYEGLGIVKLDRDSKLIWGNPNRAHHDLQVMPDGRIFVLTREARLVPRVHADEPILEDFISVLAPDGSEQQRISLLESVEHSGFAELKARTTGRSGDIYHTNTLEVLDGRIEDTVPEFAAGNVLVYMLGIGSLAVVDPHAKEVVWASSGPRLLLRHDPKVLANGNLLLFRNTDGPESSKVVEYESVTQQVVWSFEGTEERPFFSRSCGSAERLPNGNTLITETDAGRAFEVTADGRVVWEFVSPHRTGAEAELIAAVMDLVRLPADYAAWAIAADSPL